MVKELSSKASQLLAKDKRFRALSRREKDNLKKRLEFMTPTDRAAWEDFMVKMVKDRVCVSYLSDLGLRNVIRAARRNIGKKFDRLDGHPHDPDMPDCYYWTEEDVGTWISMNGHPELKEAFLLNHISGRKLAALDASALVKMGYRNFADIKDVTAKIREMLQIPAPNMMRALARLVPMEAFLRKRVYNGRTYDQLTFQKFCQSANFPYDYLLDTNMNAAISGTAQVLITLTHETDKDFEEDSDNGTDSLYDTPTVEFVARNVIIRNKIVQYVIDHLLEQAFVPPDQRKYGVETYDQILKMINKGMQIMGIRGDVMSYGVDKIEFVRGIGDKLVKEMLHTTDILNDISTTSQNVKRKVTVEEYEQMKTVAGIFIENVMPIAALLSLGELDIETMFRQDKTLQNFVGSIVDEACRETDRSVTDTTVFIEDIITEAKITIVSILYPELDVEEIRKVAEVKNSKINLLDEMMANAIQDYDNEKKTEEELNTFLSELRPVPDLDVTAEAEWNLTPLPVSKSIVYPIDQKLDSQGNPIIERLDDIEIDRLIDSSIIILRNGPSKFKDPIFVEKAKQEKVHRHQQRKKVYNELRAAATQRKFPGRIDAAGILEEFTIEDKFDGFGVPVVAKLNEEELDLIIINGIVKADEGLQYAGEGTIAEARVEKRKRTQDEFIDNIRYNDYRRNYPGKIDMHGRYEEYSDEEKIGKKGRLLIDRLNISELTRLLQDGMIAGRQFRMEGDILERVQSEINRRRKEALQDKIRWQNYQRKYPGRSKKDGSFEEFSTEEKFDKNHVPLVSKLNDEELDKIIANGQVLRGTEIQTVSAAVVTKALAEKARRNHEQELIQQRFNAYKRHNPGRSDKQNIFFEYTDQEKLDSQGVPILARLNAKELEAFIKTGTFQNKDFSDFNNGKLLNKAKFENERRLIEEQVAQVEQKINQLSYPGKQIGGTFKEFPLKTKFRPDGLPILDRLTMVEINEILETGMLQLHGPDWSGEIIKFDEVVLEEVKLEVKRRDSEKENAQKQLKLLQDKFMKRQRIEFEQDRAGTPNKSKPTLVPGPASSRAAFTQAEKYDSNGVPILERLTDAELIEMIQRGASEDNLRTSLVMEAMVERQKRMAEHEKFRQWKKAQDLATPEPPKKEAAPEKPKTSKSSLHLDVVYQSVFEKKEKKSNQFTTPEQQRLQTLSKLREVLEINKSLEEYDKNIKSTDSSSQISIPAKLEAESSPSRATLALFNGFIIDEMARVWGTADPTTGQIRDNVGNIIGRITPDGEVILKEFNGQANVNLGKLGADVEQVGVGKFRALPRKIDLKGPMLILDPDGVLKQWNLHQARIFGELVYNDGETWITTRGDLVTAYSGTALAQQIQTFQGFKPEQVILLDLDTTQKIMDHRNAKETGKSFQTEETIATDYDQTTAKKVVISGRVSYSDLSMATTISTTESMEELNAKLAEVQSKPILRWTRKEKRKQLRTLAKIDMGMTNRTYSVGATMAKGQAGGGAAFVVSTNDFVRVPVSGKWGVQKAPVNEKDPHIFKPPSTKKLVGSNVLGDQESMDELMTLDPSVADLTDKETKTNDEGETSNEQEGAGEARKLIGPDGKLIGNIQRDGKIYNHKRELIGQVKSNGNIISTEGHPQLGAGLKIVKQNGVVVAHTNDKGKVVKTRAKDRLLIGRIWADGRIVTMDNTLVGVVAKDGRIVGAGGKPIGLFTPGWELLGTDGIPFAYVTSEGKVYRYEVIPQSRNGPMSTASKIALRERLKSLHEEISSTELANLIHTEDLDNAFEVTQSKLTKGGYLIVKNTSSLNPKLMAARKADEEANEKIRLDIAAKKKERENLKKHEDRLRSYDKDDTHKVGKPKKSKSEDIEGVISEKEIDDMMTKIRNKQKNLRKATPDMNAEEQEHYLSEKRKHRKELVENWAHEVGSIHMKGQSFFQIDPLLNKQERQRVVRMAADSIIDDIFKLALTRLLLQAEAGDDAEMIMEALDKIETTGDDYTQAMWKLNRSSQVVAAKIANELLPHPGDEGVLEYTNLLLKEKGARRETGSSSNANKDSAEVGTTTDPTTGDDNRSRGSSRGGSRTHHHHRHHHRHSRHSRHSRNSRNSRHSRNHSRNHSDGQSRHEHRAHSRDHRGHGHEHHEHHEHGHEHHEHGHEHHEHGHEPHDHGHHEHHHHHHHQHEHQHQDHRISGQEQQGHHHFVPPDTKGLFKHIIDADEIEHVIASHTALPRLEQQLGFAPAPQHHHKHSDGRRNTHLSHDGRLPHIPHPGVQGRHLSLQQEREERAEEIHHGHAQLQALDINILPQIRRNTLQ